MLVVVRCVQYVWVCVWCKQLPQQLLHIACLYKPTYSSIPLIQAYISKIFPLTIVNEPHKWPNDYKNRTVFLYSVDIAIEETVGNIAVLACHKTKGRIGIYVKWRKGRGRKGKQRKNRSGNVTPSKCASHVCVEGGGDGWGEGVLGPGDQRTQKPPRTG